MNKIILVIGPTGSGKTTFRKKHLADFPCVSPDDFIVGRWTKDKCYLAYLHSYRMAREMCKAGESFVVDEQHVKTKERKMWHDLAKEFGYTTEGYIIVTPWEQILSNHQSRGIRGFYGEVPMDVIKDNYEKFQNHLKHKTIYNGLDHHKIIKWEDISAPLDNLGRCI